MEDPLQRFHEYALNHAEVAQRQAALVELPLLHPQLEDVADDVGDLLLVLRAPGPDDALAAVGQHQDRRLARLGSRAGIGEPSQVDRLFVAPG